MELNSFQTYCNRIIQTGLGLNPDAHETCYADDAGVTTVKALTIQKCFFYYEFESLLGSNVTITPTYVMEFGQPDQINLEPQEKRMEIDPDLEITATDSQKANELEEETSIHSGEKEFEEETSAHQRKQELGQETIDERDYISTIVGHFGVERPRALQEKDIQAWLVNYQNFLRALQSS